MRILALDLATKTGWAHSNGESGVQDFALKRGESPGMRFIRFRTWIQEWSHGAIRPHVIAYEQAHHRGGAATHVAENLIGRVLEFSAEHDIDTSPYHTAHIKKYATGRGNASKDEMIAAAQAKWPDATIIDDNHADAMWLLALAQRDLGGTADTCFVSPF